MPRIPLIVLAGFLCACAANVRADFVSYVGQYELKPLYPARPNFGSGTVFRIERAADGSRYTRVLCRTFFARDNSIRTPVSLPSVEYSDPDRFAEAVGIIYGLLSNARLAEENLLAQKTRAIRLSYADAFIERLPWTGKLADGKASVELDSTCLDALAKLAHGGKREPIYVVDRALSVGRFIVRIERPPESTLDATDVLGMNSEYDYRSNGRDNVEIEAPYYLGMSARLIDDIAPASPGAKPAQRIVKLTPAKLPEPFRAWQ